MNQQKNGAAVDVPRHVNPTQADRIASAPYNFVPLPEVVVTAAPAPEDLPSHDVYASAAGGGGSDSAYANTGYFDVELTALSPLYVRCGLTREQFVRQERRRRQDQRDEQRQPEKEGERDEQDVTFRERVKNRPEFFYTADPAQPVIPGSSLRGMLRSVLEIASYGKVGRVTDKRPFYRSLGDPALKSKYTANFVQDCGMVQRGSHPRAACYRSRVRAGFLRKDGDLFVIDECDYGRVERQAGGKTSANIASLFPDTRLYGGKNPMRPSWACQQHDIYAELDPEDDHFFVRQDGPHGGLRHPDLYLRFRAVARMALGIAPGLQLATLILTGDMPNKHLEYVFLHTQVRKFNVPPEMTDRFNDEDQITQWQEQAFPKHEPGSPARERPGLLRVTTKPFVEPVFFLTREDDPNQVLFFGRAQMFRLPYDHTPLDLVPAELRGEDNVDYAEALFGYVRDKRDKEDGTGQSSNARQGEKARAYAGRISVGDANLVAGQGDIRAAQPIVPPILGTPKPTAFQHYLVQQQSDRDRLTHFDIPGATLRGHKRYWHQGQRTLDDIALKDVVPPASTQHTQFRPVLSGARFLFRVHFENLSERELGALCWTLHPRGPEGVEYAHSLGMGKSLGMGGVRLHAMLHLTDRAKRYGRLFAADGSWETGEDTAPVDLSDRAALAKHTEAFEQHVLGEIGLAGEAPHGLYDVKRIAMLLRLMEWPGVRPQPSTPSNSANRPNRPNRQGNVRTMRFDEFRSRPVLPDPSAFDRPLSGDLEPRRTAIRGDGHGESGHAPATEPAKAAGGRMAEEAMAQRAETLRRGAIEQPATPAFKRGVVVEAEVLRLNKARGIIRVRLRQDGQEPPAIKNVSPVLMDLDGLDQGSTISCKIEEVDQKSGYVQRVSWKRQR